MRGGFIAHESPPCFERIHVSDYIACSEDVGPKMACPLRLGHRGPHARPDDPSKPWEYTDNGTWCGSEPYQKHDFRFLRQAPFLETKYDDRGVPLPGSYQTGPVDIFFCTKCLIKREVPA